MLLVKEWQISAVVSLPSIALRFLFECSSIPLRLHFQFYSLRSPHFTDFTCPRRCLLWLSLVAPCLLLTLCHDIPLPSPTRRLPPSTLIPRPCHVDHLLSVGWGWHPTWISRSPCVCVFLSSILHLCLCLSLLFSQWGTFYKGKGGGGGEDATLTCVTRVLWIRQGIFWRGEREVFEMEPSLPHCWEDPQYFFTKECSLAGREEFVKFGWEALQ